ncbi:hypothetical protein [Wolbachia endosymbiont of Tetranychus urticae]|uniref:hypothetical protein n=1 Tax=Wolbachia endosymbiont of Tetranychus urticae TaxID=169184 RepID=UPI0039795605
MFYHIDKESIDKVINVLNILMIDNRFWNHNIRLNNLILGKELIKRINIEQIDHSCLTTQLYDFACLLCSEEHIRELFFRSDNYNESWTTEKFVSDILNRNGEGPLIKFWSHYINIVGIENPNPVIFSSFKELLSKYSEDFDIDNINDIWKCGFECAKEQGSREALEFFWSKIKHQYEEKEREDILVNLGINAYSLCCFNRENNFNLIEFSLDHLGSAKYKYFVEESCKFENYFGTIFSLIDNYLYNEAKELISVLDFNVIDCERYGDSLICGTLQKVHNAPYKLKKQSFDFFSWIWTFEQLEEHRRYCLSDLYYIFDALKDSDELEVLVDPLKLVLNSASPEQIKRGFLTYPGSSICSTLYIKDERALLQNEVLKFFQDGDKFIDYVDNLVLNTLTTLILD